MTTRLGFITLIANQLRQAVDGFLTTHYLKDIPLHIQFDLTNACNLTCEHCYHPHHQNSGVLNFEQWIGVLDQYKSLLKKMRMSPAITICGGEPFLTPILMPFLREIRNRFWDCPVHVLSNGTKFNSEIIEKLKTLRIEIQISIDGPDAPRHDMIRGGGSFARTIAGCEMLRLAEIPFYIQAVLSRRSSEWIADYFTLVTSLGASAMNFVRMVAVGNASVLQNQHEDAPLDGLALKHAMQTILATSRHAGIYTSTHGPLWCLIDPKLGSFSDIGVNAIIIGYRGEFKPSSRLPLVLGNVLTDGMENLYMKHPMMQRLRNGDIETCKSCSHFYNCRGSRNASYAKHGHLFGPDTGCWLLH